ncbi:hypothetical protein [Kutzneria buriramensis]|uniref:Uncharacterized protein n=1 Tax=Kutzneria buriramensis TaxID=1045776 RepID=A0A3E0I751_9PSEU|nr:hypothetical protein [Kutzneria buriramensis]REH54441.1 hypothetical protein BCF44_102673 [Kutzneria buriramensis]
MPDTAVLPVGERTPLPPPGSYRLAGCALECTPFPLLHRRIRPTGGELVVADETTLTLTDLITATVTVEDRRRLRVTGWLDLRGRRHTLRLTGRVVHVDDDGVVFAATGTAVAAGRRRIRVDAASEFVR